MSTIQRLTEADVEGIFGYLHGSHPNPDHLKFQIVPVGPSGLRLSPPAIEFENGLYVLLRPERKDRPKPKVPPHLLQHVVKAVPEQSCPWSLSGPQFPTPTKLQQRYCYPKGNPMYSSQKGGALWTAYDSDGKEDLTYRLLHVYFSAKRAGIRSATPSPLRRRRRVSTPTSASSSASSKTKSPATPVPSVVPTSPWPPRGAMPPRPYWQPHHHHHHHHHPHYPTVPATLVHPTPPPPMRPATKHYLPPPPPPPSGYKRHKADIPTPPPTRSMITTNSGNVNHPGNPGGNSSGTDMFVDTTAKMIPLQEEDEDGWWMMGGTGGAILEAPELGLLDHDDEMALRTKLSFELLPFALNEDSSRMENLLLLDGEERVSRAKDDSKRKKDSALDTPTNLQKRLEIMHLHLLEWIQQQPKEKQPLLHQMVRKWAEKLQSDLELKDDGDTKVAAAPTDPATPSNKESPTEPLRTAVTTLNGGPPIKMESV